MKGGFEGSLFGGAVWVIASTEIISATKWEVGCECQQAAASQAYAKIAGAVVLSFDLTRTRHFFVA